MESHASDIHTILPLHDEDVLFIKVLGSPCNAPEGRVVSFYRIPGTEEFDTNAARLATQLEAMPRPADYLVDFIPHPRGMLTAECDARGCVKRRECFNAILLFTCTTTWLVQLLICDSTNREIVVGRAR